MTLCNYCGQPKGQHASNCVIANPKPELVEQFRRECCGNACSGCNRLFNTIVYGLETDEWLLPPQTKLSSTA